ncbi:MAG: hypothetical protein AB7H96_14660 [Vicinamibacterales bacterium]
MSHGYYNLRLALHTLNRAQLRTARRREPVVLGVPLPRGAVREASSVRAESPEGRPLPMAGRVADRWPDGSVRWLFCDLLVDAEPGSECPVVLTTSARPAGADLPAVQVSTTAGGLRIDTGPAAFVLGAARPFPFGTVSVDRHAYLDDAASGLEVEVNGQRFTIAIASTALRSHTPVRCEVLVTGAARHGAMCPLTIEARLVFVAGSATVRAEITQVNPRRAEHPGGCWVLGDRGSLQVRSVCRLTPLRGIDDVHARISTDDAYDGPVPFEVHQESSGGAAWNGRIHVNHEGRVPLRFRGYRVRTPGGERNGLRAAPVVEVAGDGRSLTVAVPDFWQNFPQAIGVDARCLEIGFFPAQASDPQELQGGEQKTHALVVAFAPDDVTDEPLAWVHDPLLVGPNPDWIASTGAVPFLTAAARDPHQEYLALVSTALDAEHGFPTKQERADQYGWRHFGDLPADHESAFLPEGQVNVSHYNNQYDALAWFAVHFLRTGDPRWHGLMGSLAAHVRDIDIYHTRGDKAAYNGGLFWHTDHYVDAGTSTHRTYPTGSDGGGPSNEHNYNVGLWLHYLLTGDERSKDAAVGLGQWVLDMDDGSQAVFKYLAHGATGLASSTGSSTYHGPGRGAANSILACMVAHQLTADARFAAKADELIRRCIHPLDDLSARRLDDVERRWYYTVFLQTLGQYLYAKWERGEFDAMFDYARASLLHYSAYIVDHETPYLEHPERLEFPTETWVAQDLRKGDALLWAAFFAIDPVSRARFLASADRFFEYAIPTLRGMATHVYTRPTTLALALGWRRAWFGTHPLPEVPGAAAVPATWDPPIAFVPQKQVAFARAKWLAAAAGAAVLGLALILLTEFL